MRFSPDPGWRRFVLWALVGVAATSAVVLSDLGRLLTDIESAGRRAYGPGVFTGFKLVFWDASELADAVNLWRQAPTDTFSVRRLIGVHVGVDLVFLVPSYCALLGVGLKALGAQGKVPSAVALATFAADELETLWTGVVLVVGNLRWTSDAALVPLQALSVAKWTCLGAAFVIAVISFRNGHGMTSARVLSALVAAREGRGQAPILALRGLILLVLLFIATIALPLSGPLNQFPDVIRAQLTGDGSRWVLVLSTMALLLLAGAVAVAGLASTDVKTAGARPPDLSSSRVLKWTVAWGVLLSAAAYCLDRELRLAPFAPMLLVLGIWSASYLATRAGVAASWAGALSGNTPGDTRSRPQRDLDEKQWIGALSGTVIVAGALGLVRAALPPVMLGVEPGARVPPWWLVMVFGSVLAVVGGFVMQKVVLETVGRWELWAKWARIAVVAVILAPAVWLCVWPEQGHWFGTTGVIAIGLAALSLVVGATMWLSRRFSGWSATYALGFGVRTPWLGLVVTSWFVASLLNTSGVYHDARVSTQLGPGGHRYADLDAAFTAWKAAQPVECAAGTGTVPLVFAAAPGGGIRAAYWTAASFDRLFGASAGRCASQRLFAISGVSGGSVGAATWIMARSVGEDGSAAASKMSQDRGLAAAAAGLLLRDLYQPYLGIATRWRNRAALLEDSWTTSTGFKGEGPGVRWSEVGQGLPWVPVLVMNASSVTDGCRVLIANVGRLPASPTGDCQSARTNGMGGGPVTASIDAFRGLYERGEDLKTCGGTEAGLRAVTAALLSARFPLVTPSGALLRCVPRTPSPGNRSNAVTTPDTFVTYAVDGGYFENTGIVTLLQLWSAIEPLVERHNAQPGALGRIQPWFLIVDNHYRSGAAIASHRRPLELVAPLRTLTNNGLVGAAALEQMVVAALRPDSTACATGSAMRVPEGSGGCLAILAPTARPAVSAPLGWVLSQASRADLDGQLVARFTGSTTADAALKALSRQLNSIGPDR